MDAGPEAAEQVSPGLAVQWAAAERRRPRRSLATPAATPRLPPWRPRRRQGRHAGWAHGCRATGRPPAQESFRGRGGHESRGGRGGHDVSRGGFQPGRPQQLKKETLKFEQDYDFEQANEQFQEVLSKLSKTTIEDTAATTASEVGQENGDAAVVEEQEEV